MIKPEDGQDLIVLDLRNQEVNVTVNPQGTIIWVNVDGMCRLRVAAAKSIKIEDRRENKR